MKNEPQTPESKPIQFPKNYRDDPPSVPVGLFVQEAMDLYKWCSSDKEALVHAGLDWSVVEEIPGRAELLSGMQSEWVEVRIKPKEYTKQWKEQLFEAKKLKRKLIHELKFAFHRHPSELKSIKQFVKNEPIENFIITLISLGMMGVDNSALLEKVHVDPEIFRGAIEKAQALRDLKSKVFVSNLYDEFQGRRNRAFWHLKVAVNEVRRVGQYLFWNDKDKLKGYVSLYKKNKRQRQQKTTQDPNKK